MDRERSHPCELGPVTMCVPSVFSHCGSSAIPSMLVPKQNLSHVTVSAFFSPGVKLIIKLPPHFGHLNLTTSSELARAICPGSSLICFFVSLFICLLRFEVSGNGPQRLGRMLRLPPTATDSYSWRFLPLLLGKFSGAFPHGRLFQPNYFDSGMPEN